MSYQCVVYSDIVDNFNPDQMWKHLNMTKEVERIALCSLVSLDVFEIHLAHRLRLSARFIYVLGDSSVKWMVDHVMPDADIKPALSSLMISSYIYRYTVAKKFMIQKTSTKQLRINSWGQEYIQSHVCYCDFQNKLRGAIEDEIDEKYQIYSEITSLLKSSITHESAGKIANLNSLLNIRVLS